MKTETRRKCFISGEFHSTRDLLRFNYTKTTGEIVLDVNNQLKGRGVYFFPTAENWNKIVKTKGLNRIFRTNVAKEIYTTIDEELKELNLWVKLKD
ncbi:Putative transciprtional termination factor [Mycoplasmopsis columbinasalis]|uniref:Transciprtional termination factor n=2 Tax=Mycoplasmopsis columbinasalis TaxID=114880 RepID=A0A449BAU3_9BACT|nr:Putative transciprtional termination factor [Mycoplasmopsis columbinasalis]